MFEIKIKTPKISVPAKLVTKQIMLAAGLRVVNNYKQRIIQGKGVDESGNITRLKALSDLTKANRKKGGKGAIPLVDIGRMKDSFRVDDALTTDTRAVMNFPTTEAWKAGIHQKGITIKAKKAGGYLLVPYGTEYRRLKQVVIPARPHVGFSLQDKRDAINEIAHHSLDMLKKGITFKQE